MKKVAITSIIFAIMTLLGTCQPAQAPAVALALALALVQQVNRPGSSAAPW